MEEMASRLHVVEGLEVVTDPGAATVAETSISAGWDDVPDYDQFRISEYAQMGFLYGHNAMTSYGENLRGEYLAKYLYAAGLLMGAKNGMGIGVLGYPGGGKSAITKYGWSIVKGIGHEDVAEVPHRLDLTPAELMGKESMMTRSTYVPGAGKNSEGEWQHETISGKQEPIIKPNTKAILFDEGNRTSPLAINAALEVLQTGKMYVYEEGELKVVSDIDLVASAMNNHGTKHTNHLDPAFIGRHGAAAFMNERPAGGLTEGANWRWDHPEGKFEIKPFRPIILRDQLHDMRGKLSYMPMDPAVKDYGKRTEVKMLDYLDLHDLNFADTRPADQLVRMSQAFAMLRGQHEVTKSNIREAVIFWTIARLGMTGMIESNGEAQKIVHSNFTLTIDRLEADKETRRQEALTALDKEYDQIDTEALDNLDSLESLIPVPAAK